MDKARECRKNCICRKKKRNRSLLPGDQDTRRNWPFIHTNEQQIILYRSVCDDAYRSPGSVCLLFLLQIHQFKPSQGIFWQLFWLTIFLQQIDTYSKDNFVYKTSPLMLRFELAICTRKQRVFQLPWGSLWVLHSSKLGFCAARLKLRKMQYFFIRGRPPILRGPTVFSCK